MGFSTLPQSQITALRTSFFDHSQEPTTQGASIRVSFSPANSSITTSMSLCCCNRLAGIISVSTPSTTFCTTSALFSPHAMSTIFLALRIVPTPMVIAIVGTSFSCEKDLDCTLREWKLNCTRRVRDFSYEPGSLKPSWPCSPIPMTMKSTFPAILSYALQ